MKLFIFLSTLFSLLLLAKSQATLSNDSCKMLFDSDYLFDLCAYNNTYFNLTLMFKEVVSFSLGGSYTPSCANSEKVWASITNELGDCVGIETSDPTYIPTVYPHWQWDGGLAINYSITALSPTGMNYQLQLDLGCANATNPFFQIQEVLSMNETMTIYSLSGFSLYACGTALTCLPTPLGNAFYNLCNLPQNIMTVPMGVGGYLAFTFNQTGFSCSGQMTYAAYYDQHGNCYGYYPSGGDFGPYSNETIIWSVQGQSLLPENHYNYEEAIDVILNCDPSQDPFDIAAQFNNMTVGQLYTISVTGKSPFACPLPQDTLTA